MRILRDESVHLGVAELLRKRGHDAGHIIETKLGGSSDEAVLAEAIRRQAVLVSHDSDFHRILAQTRATHPSVIRLRIEVIHPPTVTRLIEQALEQLGDWIEIGSVVSIDDRSIRARRLPLV